MKKMIMAFCCAALAVAAFAEPKAGAQGRKGPGGRANPGMQRPNGAGGFQMPNGFQMPTTLKIDSSTTAQQIKDFKKQVMEKIDAAYKARPTKNGGEGKQTTLIFFANDGSFGGMGGMGGMPGMGGFGGQGGMPPGMPNMMPGAPAQ